nr:GPI ethanolamine phosphate transferase 3 isoform X1 [Ipomoea batatas]
MLSESVQQCCGVPEEAHISLEEESDGCGGKMRGFLSCAEFSQYSQCSDIHHSPPLSTSSSILSQSKGMRKWRNVLIMFRTKAEGLTTGGGLATFVDLGSTVEKNLIYQMVHIGKLSVDDVMGDHTWSLLFPKHFNRYYPFPSFIWQAMAASSTYCHSRAKFV